jgi:hypothetical protein
LRLFIIKSHGITKCETPKSQKQEDSFEYRELEESRLFIIRSPGIVKCKTLKSRKQEDSFRYRVWKSRDSSSSGVPESRNVKPQKPKTGTSTGGSDTGSWRSQELRLFITRVPKSRNAKRRNTFLCRFPIPRYGASKHFITRNVGMPKCRNVKNTFWCWFRIPGVGVLKHFATQMSK